MCGFKSGLKQERHHNKTSGYDMSKAKILIVEDETIIAMDLKLKLEQEGYKVTGLVASGEEAIEMALQHKPDIILMDIMINGAIDGVEAARRILEKLKTKIIFITGNSNLKKSEKLLKVKPFAVLPKPTSEWLMLETIERATGILEPV